MALIKNISRLVVGAILIIGATGMCFAQHPHPNGGKNHGTVARPGKTTEFRDSIGRFVLWVPRNSSWNKLPGPPNEGMEFGLVKLSPRAYCLASAKDTATTLPQLDSTLRARMDTSTTKILKDEPYILEGRVCKHFEIQSIINGVPQIMSIFAYAGKGWTMKFAIWAAKEIVAKNPDVLLAPVAFLHILKP